MKVKILLTLFLGMFPFLHNEVYDVKFYSCEKNRIIVSHQDQPFEVRLFNMKIKDDNGWEKTCRILKHAKKIQMEIDSSSKIQEPLDAYLFVEDKLLQEILVKDNLAYTVVKNPEYKYEKQLQILQEDKQVMAKPSSYDSKAYANAQGKLFLFSVFLSWSVMLFYGLYRRRNKNIK